MDMNSIASFAQALMDRQRERDHAILNVQIERAKTEARDEIEKCRVTMNEQIDKARAFFQEQLNQASAMIFANGERAGREQALNEVEQAIEERKGLHAELDDVEKIRNRGKH